MNYLEILSLTGLGLLAIYFYLKHIFPVVNILNEEDVVDEVNE